MIDPRVLLSELVAATPEADLPRLVGALVEAEEQARHRLRSAPLQGAGNGQADAERLIKPEAAATIACVDTRTIYDWAAGKAGKLWARRPSRRCLRIEEATFRRWLAAR
jgi:hypothetical protein